MSFEVDNCCFCIDLRVGSLVIGYLGLVGCIIFALISVLGIAASGYVTATATEENTQLVGTAALIFLCVFLVVVLVHLLFDIILLIGLHKNKRGNVRAYIIFGSIFLVIGAINMVGSIFTGQELAKIMQSLVVLVVNAYFLLVIRSYYLKMDDPTKRPAIYNTA